MRWAMYENAGNPKLGAGDELPTKWNTSFRRAAYGLAERGLVAINKRPLKSFKECVDHYPEKTLISNTRSLRRRLLPTLLEWTEEASGRWPKYGVAANETYHLQRLSQRQRERINARWLRIEESLRSIYGAAAKSNDDLLRLICKGRALFRCNDIAVDSSLDGLIESACLGNIVTEALAAELRGFKEQFLPAQSAQALRLKSFIHELADVPSTGKCRLKIGTLEYLHKHQKDFVEAMPGFRRKENSFRSLWARQRDANEYEYEYDSELEQLFDHTVFQRFCFMSRRS